MQIKSDHLTLNRPHVTMPPGRSTNQNPVTQQPIPPMLPFCSTNKNPLTQQPIPPPPGFEHLATYPTPGIDLTTLFPTVPTNTMVNTLHYRSTYGLATNFALSPLPSVIPPWVSDSVPVLPLSCPPIPLPLPHGTLPPPEVFSPMHTPVESPQRGFKVDISRRSDQVFSIVPAGADFRDTDMTHDYHFFWPTLQRSFTFRTTSNCHLVRIVRIMADELGVPRRGWIQLGNNFVSCRKDLWSFSVQTCFTITPDTRRPKKDVNNPQEVVASPDVASIPESTNTSPVSQNQHKLTFSSLSSPPPS